MAKPSRLIALFLPFFVAACASTPMPQSSLDVPQQFLHSEGTVAEIPHSRWWGVFEDAQLDALVAYALEHNRDLRVALERLARAQAASSAESNNLLPGGSVGVGVTRHRTPAVESPDGQPSVSEHTGVRVESAWDVDLFGRLRAAARAGQLESVATNSDVESLRSFLLAEVATAYFHWQGLQAQTVALSAIVEGQHQQVRLARTRFELGAADELDLRRAQSELRTSEARLVSLGAETSSVANRIALLSGLFPSELALSPREIAPLEPRVLALGTPHWVLSRRPDIAAAEARLKAAHARSDSAWAALLPRLTLSGSLGVLAGSGSDLAGDAARAWSLQSTLTIPLLDLLRLEPLRQARNAEARGALATYEKAILAAVAEVESNSAAYNAASARVQLLAARRDDAVRALEIAEARHKAGAADQLTVIDGQRTLRTAAIELAAAIAEHRITVVNLYRSLGAPVDEYSPRAG